MKGMNVTFRPPSSTKKVLNGQKVKEKTQCKTITFFIRLKIKNENSLLNNINFD